MYYEADCFAQLKNPYLPLDEDGSLAEAVLKQKTLKGEGIKERAEAAQIMQDAFAKIIQGQTFDTEEIKKYYQAMATDILNEKRRIGGHWAIAHVVLQRKFRDCIRFDIWKTSKYFQKFDTNNLKGNSWSQLNLHSIDNVSRGKKRTSKIQTQRCRGCS